MATDAHESADEPIDQSYPPLDVVDSRWWYWIAAYVLSTVLFVPVIVVALLAFLTPIAVVGPGTDPSVGAPLGILALLFVFFVFAFVMLAAVIFVVFPVALYLDARQVAQADLNWEPDPVLYGGLGLLQFVVTPVIGLAVAIYYLYQRHKYVGVP